MMSFECSSEDACAGLFVSHHEYFAPSIFNDITAKSELEDVGKAGYEQWKHTDWCKILYTSPGYPEII